MHAAAEYRQEKQELGAVLASGIFSRAPNLEHLLTYVCAKYFEGSANQIKEYNIAVDALGRSSEFDQKRDSIVRVEAHRLRKRLREYYERDGRDHALRIDIPPGQYAPRFVPCAAPLTSLSPETTVVPVEAAQAEPVPVQPSPEAQPEATELIPSPLEVDIPPVAREGAPGVRSAALFITLLLVGGVAAIAFWGNPAKDGVRKAALPPPVVPADSRPLEVRILAGSLNSEYTDRLGQVWQSDRYFNGGGVFESRDHPIFGTREPRIYQSRREGTFGYDIPLPPGVYELRLHFAETLYGENNVAGGGEASRIFNVWMNGKEALHEFDVVSEAGPSTAHIRAFKDVSPEADGKLHLRFEPFTNPALLSGIEITPGTPGRLRPIRMVSMDRIYTDKDGRTWEPDRYAHGGQLIERTKPVEGVADPGLFRGERFGNIRYVIPVPPGRYGVTFYFAEAWFGPDSPAGGGAGSRVFDIFCNGMSLRRGFDVFREARGAGRGISWSVHGLAPDGQGKLAIALTPLRNYASVNAVEVVDESK